MKDEKVTFEMVFPIEPYRNFKLGYEGSIYPDETYIEAAKKAFNKVMAAGDQIYAALRIPISTPTVVTSFTTQEAVAADPAIEAEFDALRITIQEAPTAQIAEKLLQNSSFKYNIELKEIIKNKQ
jgi:hypothetical protein